MMRAFTALAAATLGLLALSPAVAGVFLFAEQQNNPNIIAHPSGYTGSQNQLTISVCIAPNSESITQMVIPLRNVIKTWNELQPVVNNLRRNSPEVPNNHFDYESVLLHEVGHCIGLAHPNLASESGQSGNNRRFAKALRGPNGSYDLNAGTDGVIGTRADLRGDDVNLGWFRKGVNNPFLFEPVIDASTYSVDLADLPAGHNFVEVGALQVAQLRGLPDSEAVMHQGTRARETRRALAPDDATMMRLGMAGVDRTQGTADDYTYTLVYGGIANGCDITVRTTGNSFGQCGVSASFLPGGQHIRIVSGEITMGSTSAYNWYFNTVLRTDPSLFRDRFQQ